MRGCMIQTHLKKQQGTIIKRTSNGNEGAKRAEGYACMHWRSDKNSCDVKVWRRPFGDQMQPTTPNLLARACVCAHRKSWQCVRSSYYSIQNNSSDVQINMKKIRCAPRSASRIPWTRFAVANDKNTHRCWRVEDGERWWLDILKASRGDFCGCSVIVRVSLVWVLGWVLARVLVVWHEYHIRLSMSIGCRASVSALVLAWVLVV